MHEKPQKGNPHQLTVDQHCFPRACIARFCDDDGTVAVKTTSDQGIVRRKPTAKIFCAKRAWDQKAETGFMQAVERNYHSLAERICTYGERALSEEDSETITAMYCLWCIRSMHRNSPIADQVIKGVLGLAAEVTKDNMEELEAAGIFSVRPDMTIPGRQLAGITILRNLDLARDKLKGTRWLILESTSDEFVAPDQALARMILPLSPILCFVHECETAILNGGLNVNGINQLMINQSLEYYFGRSLQG
jgi:hypothetical protein